MLSGDECEAIFEQVRQDLNTVANQRIAAARADDDQRLFEARCALEAKWLAAMTDPPPTDPGRIYLQLHTSNPGVPADDQTDGPVTLVDDAESSTRATIDAFCKDDRQAFATARRCAFMAAIEAGWAFTPAECERFAAALVAYESARGHAQAPLVAAQERGIVDLVLAGWYWSNGTPEGDAEDREDASGPSAAMEREEASDILSAYERARLA